MTRSHTVRSMGNWQSEQCTVQQIELKPSYQTSAAVQMRSSLFWAVTQRILAVI